MALIERVSISHSGPIADRSIHTSEDASGVEHHAVEVASGIPGLRISSRLTTSSLADYPQFDLGSIGRPDRAGVVTDGASS